MRFTRKQLLLLKSLPLGFLLLFLLFVGALLLAGVIIHEVLVEEDFELDHAVADFVSANLVHPSFTPFMKAISYLASSTVLLPAYTLLAAYLVFIKKEIARGVGVAMIGISGYLITHSLKDLFARQRPQDQLIELLTNFSFPSGHSVSAILFWGVVVYLLAQASLSTGWKVLGYCLSVIIAMLIGFSRIYLGVHFFTDVIAGFAVGFAWLLLSLWLIEKFTHQKKVHPAPSSDEKN